MLVAWNNRISLMIDVVRLCIFVSDSDTLLPDMIDTMLKSFPGLYNQMSFPVLALSVDRLLLLMIVCWRALR